MYEVYVCVYVMYVCYVCMYVCYVCVLCMYICMCVCLHERYVHIYTCTYVGMYVYVCTVCHLGMYHANMYITCILPSQSGGHLFAYLSMRQNILSSSDISSWAFSSSS
jgi:hypothetical protein